MINIVEKTLISNNREKGKGLKILTPKQILQGLPRTVAQVKAKDTCENFLKEILQIIFYLYQAKEVTKKVYDNIIHSIKL